MYKNIQTERLIIRPIEVEDTKFILELVNSEGWLKFIGERNVLNEDDAKQYIQTILDKSNYYYSVFELKETNVAIGVVTFLQREDQDHPDIGFALLPDFAKNGYAFEACQVYLAETFKQNDYNNVIAITVPENKNSINLIEKLGLKFSHKYKRDTEVLSLYSLI